MKGKHNSIGKVIFKFFIKIIILVLLTMLIALIISSYTNFEYRILLEYLGVLIIILGGLSAIGSRNIFSGYSYNLSRHTVEDEGFFRKEIYILFESYKFTAFMALSGLILLFISLIIYKLGY